MEEKKQNNELEIQIERTRNEILAYQKMIAFLEHLPVSDVAKRYQEIRLRSANHYSSKNEMIFNPECNHRP